MSYATKPLSNRIAVVFDFDETLIPDDSFKILLRDCQLDVEAFERERVAPLIEQGWHKYLARTYCLVQESRRREGKNKITQERLANLSQKLHLIEGVSEMFECLKKRAAEIVPEVEVEFYLISGGFVDIARNTSIAKHFTQMWGCELAYDENGEIQFLKQLMSHTEKTHYLYYLSIGIERENEQDLMYNYRDVPIKQLYVPLNQVIYVGDGTSDIPCFTVINQYGGIALGIFQDNSTAETWEHREEVTSSQQITNLVPANYKQNSELMRSLILSIECISKQIALLHLSVGE
ncbi:haloacid dehalogenase-like hydrolase [Waterburya agarophytonicola K14]|uniref:Haloacid dehalogenase-like hydrolase n=1 Tax=Waterburya agarophytonicola KI4 TaxID=2874699 RepID=A0A964C1H9_9CYAN|nr:haloacid dehalogenase-like hydrolase [Waterburya agarophytonicola]MCC0179795.1 haloacid dehalogenase-like hydrolase [Waterburya agarophytonicola KI4]